MSAPTLTHPQAVNRLEEIGEEIERLATKETLSTEDEGYLDELRSEFDEVDQHRKRLEVAAENARMAAVRDAVRARRENRTSGQYRLEAGAYAGAAQDVLEPDSVEEGRFKNPWDLSDVRTFGRPRGEVVRELQSRSLAAAEKMPYATDSVREAVTQFIERDDEQGRLSQLCLATSSPDYMRAFTKLMRANGNAVAAGFTPAENEAYTRAMSLTDNAGGYLIPMQLDPTVIITADGSFNQVRQIARVVQATGDVWHGVSSAGVTGSWDGEAAEVSDDAPTLAQPTVPVYKGQIFVPISIEAAQDAANIANEVARMVAFEKDRMESVAFVTGSGTNQPTGIVTALTGGSSEVDSATTDTFAIADVYALDSALPARYAANGTWLAHRAIYNLIRRFDTSGGAGLWTTLGNGRPDELLGRPARVAEAMDSTVTALAANLLLIFGDFSNYVIADRVGTTIEFIPHLFATGNNRPSGQRGWYAWFRVGADSVNDGAFRMLDVT